MEYGQDMSPFDMALTILNNVCGSDQDSAEIKSLFKNQFKPTCYRISITEEKIPGFSKSSEMDMSVSDDMPEGMEGMGSPILKKDQVMSAMPAYNISNDFLNRYTFVRVVKTCQPLYKLFENCLDARLRQCYGNERAKEIAPGDVSQAGAGSTTQDFGWILKKKKVKIGSKAPTIARRPTIIKNDVTDLLQD